MVNTYTETYFVYVLFARSWKTESSLNLSPFTAAAIALSVKERMCAAERAAATAVGGLAEMDIEYMLQ